MFQHTYSRFVLSGGGHKGLIQYGALKYLKEHTTILDTVTDYYGTSVGSLNIIYATLPIPIDYINDYIIKRPWHKELGFTKEKLLGAFNKNEGILDHSFFDTILDPLFEFCDMSVDITFKEFEERTQKRLHIFATEFKTMSLYICDSKHTPNMSIKDAIKMSCSIPIVFEPYEYNNKQYIDGFVYAHYPVEYAQYDKLLEHDDNAILGLHFDYDTFLSATDYVQPNKDASSFNNIFTFFMKYNTVITEKLKALEDISLYKLMREQYNNIKNIKIVNDKNNMDETQYYSFETYLENSYYGISLPCKDVQELALQTLIDDELRRTLVLKGEEFLRTIVEEDHNISDTNNHNSTSNISMSVVETVVEIEKDAYNEDSTN